MPDYFDPAGRPITMEQWVGLFDMERHVGETVVRIRGHWFRVSTVWLGLNHNWFGGPPLIFETMIFDESRTMTPVGAPWNSRTTWTGGDLAQWRYSTGEQAIRGHVHALRWLKRNVREAARPRPLIHHGRKPVGRPTKRK